MHPQSSKLHHVRFCLQVKDCLWHLWCTIYWEECKKTTLASVYKHISKTNMYLGGFSRVYNKETDTPMIETTPNHNNVLTRSYLCLMWRPGVLVDPRHVREVGRRPEERVSPQACRPAMVLFKLKTPENKTVSPSSDHRSKTKSPREARKRA